LNDHNKIKVPPNYENDFKRAELAFLYQRVFDIETERLVTLNPIPKDLDISLDTDYIGPYPIVYNYFTALVYNVSKYPNIFTQIIIEI